MYVWLKCCDRIECGITLSCTALVQTVLDLELTKTTFLAKVAFLVELIVEMLMMSVNIINFSLEHESKDHHSKAEPRPTGKSFSDFFLLNFYSSLTQTGKIFRA